MRTTEGEIIGLFITESIPPRLPPEEVMDRIHDMGGLVYLPHPLDRRRANFRPERIVEMSERVDIVETYNPWADAAANAAAEGLARDLDKVMAWGSDAHSTAELGEVWMEVDPFADPRSFLASLRSAALHRSSSSGTRRRA